MDYKKRIEKELQKQRKYFRMCLNGKLKKDLGEVLLDRIHLLEGLLE